MGTVKQLIRQERKNFHMDCIDTNRLEVYNHELATLVNRYMKRFSDGKHVFKKHEEAVFKVQENQLLTVEGILKRFVS